MKIDLDGTIIEVLYIYKPSNRGVYFTYKGKNIFQISGGIRYSEKDIYDIVYKYKNRILKIVEKNIKKQKENTIHYLGRLYNLEVRESKQNLIYLSDDKMIVEARAGANIEKLVKAFYIESVKNYTESVFDSIFEEFSDLKIKRPKLKFKYTKTFYGKCFTKENMIEISGICMKMEPRFINCVIMHELCHFKYHNHQAGFYRYFEAHLPNAKKIQHEFRNLKYQDIY